MFSETRDSGIFTSLLMLHTEHTTVSHQPPAGDPTLGRRAKGVISLDQAQGGHTLWESQRLVQPEQGQVVLVHPTTTFVSGVTDDMRHAPVALGSMGQVAGSDPDSRAAQINTEAPVRENTQDS